MNSNFLFDQIFEITSEEARKFYFGVLTSWDPNVPALNNEKISISRIGWGRQKHFYSVIWKGEEKKKESNEKRAVSRLYPRCRGVITSQLFNKLNITQTCKLSRGKKDRELIE